MDQSPPYADTSETTKLYQQHAGKLFDYFYQHLFNLPDAEDLLLEVFLKVWEHEQALGNMLEQEQRAWLWTVARNKLIDHYRHNGRRRNIPLEHIAELLDNDERMPESLALQSEEHATIRSYLMRLTPLYRLRIALSMSC